jgi:rhomboid family GlyGly-CTERM serine protease
MGLHQDSNKATEPRAHWLFPVIVSVASALILAGGADFRELTKYDRMAIQSGEFWRLLSGHFAHLGASHFVLNLAGLWLVWFLTGSRLSLSMWIVAGLTIIVGIDLGFWLLDTNLIWYVGLSGLLHGLLVAGAIAGLASQRVESIVILAAVFGKIIFEQSSGAMPGTAHLAGGPVVVDAHLFGSIGGLIAGLIVGFATRWQRWRSVDGGTSI